MQKNRYQLICFIIDKSTEKSNFVIEHNAFATDGMFSSAEEALKRNEEMGSRWVFYPYRVIIDNEYTIVSFEDWQPHKLTGRKFDSVPEVVEFLIDYLRSRIHIL